MMKAAKGKMIVVFLDYDGTLSHQLLMILTMPSCLMRSVFNFLDNNIPVFTYDSIHPNYIDYVPYAGRCVLQYGQIRASNEVAEM